MTRRTTPGKTTRNRNTSPEKPVRSFDLGLYKNGRFNWNRLAVYLLLIVGVIAITFPFWRGILFPDPVDVAFGGLSTQHRDYIRTLSPEQQSILKNLVDTDVQQTADVITALEQPPIRWDESLPSGDFRIFGEGTFSGIDALRTASGRAVIYRSDISTFLRLEGFNVKNAPELHVFLSPQRDFEPDTAMNGAVDLGALKGNGGNILIPVTASLIEKRSILIYDVKYQQFYAVAPVIYR